jgi:hypothetical protein
MVLRLLPEYITRAELDGRIEDELPMLSHEHMAWWNRHRVEPFVVMDGEHPRFAVARDGDAVIYFDDSEDEFASCLLHDGRIGNAGLYGELQSAVFGIIHYPPQ